MKRFKARGDTGLLIRTFDGVQIRIDAGQEYSTDDPREIDVLNGVAGVAEVRAAAKKEGEDSDAEDNRNA